MSKTDELPSDVSYLKRMYISMP